MVHFCNPPPANKLLGFTLIEEIARGAFGRVYRASTPDGKQVAIKVLHEEIRRNPLLLGSFRRGVRSMRFLMSRDVAGMVAYQEASEIPAFVVMDWVDGPTLQEAKESLQIDDWGSILKIGLQMTDIIRHATCAFRSGCYTVIFDLRTSCLNVTIATRTSGGWSFSTSISLGDQGALEQSVVYGALFGYLAPEQIKATLGASTRHAAVDSFGLGMTLYFMIKGRDPLPEQHRQVRLDKDGGGGCFASWKNELDLPAVSIRTTYYHGNRRQPSQALGHVTEYFNELEQFDAFRSGLKAVPAELLAEEIAARSNRVHEWNDERATAVVEFVSGAIIKIHRK